MNRKILQSAMNRFNILKNNYAGFLTVGVDNWRGFRFIYDTKDVRTCTNNCSICPLYITLKNEPAGLFTASLIDATEDDKQLFDNQNKLNCKTLQQYKQCYISFLINKTNTPEAIKQELLLIKNFTIIYSSKHRNLRKLEYNFRRDIIEDTLKLADEKKKIIIQHFL